MLEHCDLSKTGRMLRVLRILCDLLILLSVFIFIHSFVILTEKREQQQNIQFTISLACTHTHPNIHKMEMAE